MAKIASPLGIKSLTGVLQYKFIVYDNHRVRVRKPRLQPW